MSNVYFDRKQTVRNANYVFMYAVVWTVFYNCNIRNVNLAKHALSEFQSYGILKAMTLICSHSVYTLLIIAFSTWHIFYVMFDLLTYKINA